MLRTVSPHGLSAICISCGITLADLSERTGIPEQELLAFSEGVHALGARDRFAILTELTESSPAVPRQVDAESHDMTNKALAQLMWEVDEEDRAANAD